MKYFLMESDPLCVNSPRIKNWFGEIDKRKINRKEVHSIKKHTLFYINSDKEIIFTDVLTHPFFLLSEEAYKIAAKYERPLPYKQVILFDPENQHTKLYHLPVPERISCMSEESRLTVDKSKFIRPVLKADPINNKSIFWIEGFDSVIPVINLDLAESLLRRGLTGLSLTEVEIEAENR